MMIGFKAVLAKTSRGLLCSIPTGPAGRLLNRWSREQQAWSQSIVTSSRVGHQGLEADGGLISFLCFVSVAP